MNDFGMNIYDENNELRLSINDRTMRLAGSFTVPQNSTGIQIIEGITGKDPVAFVSVYNVPISNLIFPHVVTISGDIISYGITSGTTYATGPSIVWVYVTS